MKNNCSCFQSTSHRMQLLCTWVCYFPYTKTGQRVGLKCRIYNNKFPSPLHHPREVAELFYTKESNQSPMHGAKSIAAELWGSILRYTGSKSVMPLDHSLRQWDIWSQSPLLPECSATVPSWEDRPPTAKWQYQPARSGFHPAPKVTLFPKRA